MPYVALAFIVSFLLSFGAAPVLASQDSADDAIQTLHRNFEHLQRSLQAQGGLSERDKPVIQRLRDRYTAFNDEHADNRRGIAGELQLSIWLEDHDRVDVLFERLLMLDTEEISIGHAWAAYFSRLGERERVDAIYDELLRISPDSRDIRITRARRLKQQNQYHRALEILNEMPGDDANDPEVLMLRSDCLFAEHRFEEAVAELQKMSEAELDADPRIRDRIEALLPTRQQYIELWEAEQALRDAEASADDLPRAEITTPRGRIVVELFEDNAPNTVANFITLAEDEFFDETAFHRVIANFMIQGGDPNTKPGGEGRPGTGGPGYAIADEWQRDDARKHFTGTLSMANSGPDTAGSRFFITVEPRAHLNEGYTAFGRVIDGLDVVRTIQSNDVIETVRVLRKREHEYTVEKLDEPEPLARPEIPADITGELREEVERLLDEADEQGPGLE